MASLFSQMALDCIEFARDGREVRDYEVFCKRQLGAGTAYYDRIRVKDKLIDEGFVRVDGNRLRLGVAHESVWLKEALLAGEATAWAVCDIFPRKKLKFDPDDSSLKELGLEGEMFVLEQLQRNLPPSHHDRVIHVSLDDDSAGFDIRSPSIQNPESEILLEVKTSSRAGSSFHLFLSRNEAETGLRNPNWYLVLVSSHERQFDVVGVIKMGTIADLLPQDTSEQAQWVQLRLSLPRQGWTVDLP